MPVDLSTLKKLLQKYHNEKEKKRNGVINICSVVTILRSDNLADGVQ